MAAEELWEEATSGIMRETKLVHDKAVAAQAGITLTPSKCLPFAAVLIGAWAIQSLATTVLQASACAHSSAVVSIWILSVAAGLIVAVRWYWVRYCPTYLSTGGQYIKDKRTLKETAEALCPVVPAGRLERNMRLVLFYIDILPPDDPLATPIIFLEASFLTTMTLTVLLTMAAYIRVACAV